MCSSDLGKVSVGELSKQILDTSSSMGVAAADIAEAAYQAISAGQVLPLRELLDGVLTGLRRLSA